MGKVGPLSGYVSGSWIKGDLWRGPGTIDRKHYEGKLRYDLPNGGDLSFQTVHNDYYDYDSPSITKAQYAGTAGDIFGRKGRDFAYLGAVPLSVPLGTPVIVPTASLPQTAAGIAYSNANYANYYKFAVNKRKDHLYGLTLNTPITDAIDLTTTAYYEDKGGYGVSPEAYATSWAATTPRWRRPDGADRAQGHAIRSLRHRRHAQGRDGQGQLEVRLQQAGGRPLAGERRLSPHPGPLQRRQRQSRRRAAAERAGPPAARLCLDPRHRHSSS
jgi:hypothetical protein